MNDHKYIHDNYLSLIFIKLIDLLIGLLYNINNLNINNSNIIDFDNYIYKVKKKIIQIICCLRYRTMLRFDVSLVYGLCANFCFLTHRILKFQDSQLRIPINTKPKGKQKWREDREKSHFCSLVTSHPCIWKAEVWAQTINKWKISKHSIVL